MKFEIEYKKKERFRIAFLNVSIPNLPEEFRGYKILQLTDLHYGTVTRLSHIKKSIRIANQFSPNLVVLTGDFIQIGNLGIRNKVIKKYTPNSIFEKKHSLQVLKLAKKLHPVISELKAPDGVLGIFGNHDHVEGIEIIQRELSSISWLKNKSIEIRKDEKDLDSSCLFIAGVDDLKRGKIDFRDIQIPQTSFFKILLSHNPDITISKFQNELFNYNLVLCGHTHGGQIRIPGLIAFATRTKQKIHTRGLTDFVSNTLGSTKIFVNSGIGYGLVPIRTACPPEVSIITFNN